MLPSFLDFGTKKTIINKLLKFFKNMSYNDDDEVENGFRMSADDDEPLEPLVEIPDFGLDTDDEDLEKDRN